MFGRTQDFTPLQGGDELPVVSTLIEGISRQVAISEGSKPIGRCRRSCGGIN